jgi:protein-disulfide isomerase
VSRNQLIIVVVAFVIIAAAVFAYYYWPSGTSSQAAIPETTGASAYAVAAEDHTLGSPKAPVTIIEYAAPTCPHCAHFNEETFPLVKTNYIDTGKVYYVFRVFPLHPSDGAVEAMAACLPKDNYFQFIDLMFRNQKKWDWEYGVSDIHDGLVQMGRIAGLSPEQVDKCIGDKAVQDRVNKVAQDGQTKYNISGTPTFIINGGIHSSGDVGTYADMQKVLDALLAKK